MNFDRGREAVYAAEYAAFGGTSFDTKISFEELLWLRNGLQASDWWCAGEIVVERARDDALSSSTRLCSDGNLKIRIAEPQCTPLTFAHESAHVLAGVSSGHGPLFRRAEIDVVNAMFGAEPADWLRDSFRAMDLDVAKRRWNAPNEGPIQRVIGLA